MSDSPKFRSEHSNSQVCYLSQKKMLSVVLLVETVLGNIKEKRSETLGALRVSYLGEFEFLHVCVGCSAPSSHRELIASLAAALHSLPGHVRGFCRVLGCFKVF